MMKTSNNDTFENYFRYHLECHFGSEQVAAMPSDWVDAKREEYRFLTRREQASDSAKEDLFFVTLCALYNKWVIGTFAVSLYALIALLLFQGTL